MLRSEFGISATSELALQHAMGVFFVIEKPATPSLAAAQSSASPVVRVPNSATGGAPRGRARGKRKRL